MEEEGRHSIYIYNKKENKRKNQGDDSTLKTQETFQEQNILQGEINAEFIDWLGRSLVCTSEEPRDLGSLASTITSGFGYCTKICSLSNFKFIPRFPTVE